MKTKASLYIMLLSALTLGGCATSNVQKRIAVSPSPCIISPDRNGNADVSVSISVPARFFSERDRLMITPELIVDGRVEATYSPIVLDGKIYRKKSLRAEALDGQPDSHSAAAILVNTSAPYTLSFDTVAHIAGNAETARIVGRVSTAGCSKCRTYETLDMAEMATPLSLLEEPQYRIVRDNTTKEIAPKIFNGHEEANLQFAINKADINLSLGSNRTELERVRTALQPIVKSEYATLNSLKITGLASADGPLKFNTKLAKERAQSATDWLDRTIGFPSRTRTRIRIFSRPEGWAPVVAAMKADNHPAAARVESIVDRYSDESDDVAEKHIRALPAWDDIANNYLADDRKVVFEYTYTVKNFTTDKELNDMFGKRPDLFSEAEFLKVASMHSANTDSLIRIYRTAVKYHPQSDAAVNNLAALYLEKGDNLRARDLLVDFKNPSDAIRNNLAVAEARLGNIPEAIGILEGLDGEQAEFNLGQLYAIERNAVEAYRLLRPFDDLNTAIVALSVNDNHVASDILDRIDDSSPRAEYVRALAAARLGDTDGFFNHIRNAVTDSRFRVKALTEPNFRQYRTDARFRNLFPDFSTEKP